MGWKRQSVGWNGRSFWTVVRRGSTGRYAVWKTGLVGSGLYEVWVRFPKRNATTHRAKYKIFSADGVVTRKINQKWRAGRWVRLGTYRFGSVGKVKLADRTGERTRSGRHVVFDVVKFVPVSISAANSPQIVDPTVIVDGSSSARASRPSADGSPSPAPLRNVPVAPSGTPSRTLRVNEPPIADAGGPYKVAEGDAVKLDGGGSSDPDGRVVAFKWNRKTRLDDDTKKHPAFTGIDDGLFRIELVVTDDRGATDSDAADIEVVNVAPELAELGPFDVSVDEELVLGAIRILDPGSLDTHEVNVDWGDGSLEAAIVDGVVAAASHAYADPGVYEVELTVIDDDGGAGSRRVRVSVTTVADASKGKQHGP